MTTQTLASKLAALNSLSAKSETSPQTVPDFSALLAATRPEMNLGLQRSEELDKVLSFWNNYACQELQQYATICDGVNDDGSIDPNLQGRVVLEIPETAFHTQTSGFFQLKLLWPRVNDDGEITCKLSLGYKIQPDGHATELSTGGKRVDGIEFTSINSATYGLDDLFTHGYLSPTVEDRVMKFALNKMGDDKGILPLTPTGSVIIVLRNTIRPLVDNPKLNITSSKYAPGEDSGIGMAAIAFSDATLLPALTALLNAKVTDRPRRSFADIQAAYGSGHRMTATPVNATPGALPDF
jgi:hypothetical protein